MIALAVISAILILLILLLFAVPIHAVIAYENGFEAYIRILFFKYMIYPAKDKKEKEKKEKASDEKKEAPENKSKPEISEVIRGVAEKIKIILSEFRRRVRVRLSRYKIIIGGADDAAGAALLYGGAAQVSAYLMAFLDSQINFSVSRRARQGVCIDFTSFKSHAEIKLDIYANAVNIAALILAVVKTVKTPVKKLSVNNKTVG